MVSLPSILGDVSNVRDLNEGKMVNLTIPQPDISIAPDELRRIRARGRSMVAAGFARRGFLLKPDFHLSSPTLERRTEIVDEREVDDGVWAYEIRVKPGVILR